MSIAEREKNVKQLFEAARTNAQWRYRSYQRMLSTDWSKPATEAETAE